MKVIWTYTALKTYFKVSDYLLSELGDASVNNFAKKVEKIVMEIKENPFMFEESADIKILEKAL